MRRIYLIYILTSSCVSIAGARTGREDRMKLKPEDLAKLKPKQSSNIFLAKGKPFGSGKITRRVEVDCHLLSGRKKHKRAKKEYASSINTKSSSQLVSKKLKFPNSSVERIFKYWNGMKYPFTRHRLTQSARVQRILTLLISTCKKYETRQIIDAINLAHSIFLNNQFVYFYVFKNRIGLHQFLQYTKDDLKNLGSMKRVKHVRKQYGIEIPVSWFVECTKGRKYIEKTYFFQNNEIKDEYPEITRQAIRALQSHWQRELNDLGKEKMVKFSRMLVNFCGMHDPPIKDPGWLMDRIEDWLTTSHKLKIQKAYYLTTQSFWFNDIPECMRNWDPITYRQRNWNFDKDALLK